jgi:hypothetical protein
MFSGTSKKRTILNFSVGSSNFNVFTATERVLCYIELVNVVNTGGGGRIRYNFKFADGTIDTSLLRTESLICLFRDDNVYRELRNLFIVDTGGVIYYENEIGSPSATFKLHIISLEE